MKINFENRVIFASHGATLYYDLITALDGGLLQRQSF
jgi:hypothetical protein